MLKKIGKITLWIVLSLMGVLAVMVLLIWIKSPGKLEPLKDEKGQMITNAITEKDFIDIGGIQQGFFIRSENSNNPVILYLHGGPGSPELPLIEPTEKSERLEKYFTVCYWDQRGAGMSFNSSIDSNTMTIDRMVEDTREMTEYLKKRFGKDKIYLMGHSWGSYLGIKSIQKYPDNYFAYIGIGQVSNQTESEKLAYDYMMRQAVATNDKEAIKDLQKFNRDAPNFPTLSYMPTRTLLMNKYGIGMMHKDASMMGLTKDVLMFKGYTFSEKINYIRGALFSSTHVFPYVLKDNLFKSSTSFQVPVYVIQGKYDYQVSYDLAKQYMDTIKAPKKGFFTFDKSAHSPNIEEPEKFTAIVKQITLSRDTVPLN